ncbi:acetyl-CoA acetyltransferase [Sphingoaurantiacus capsulatus]|uniref:Acetyl-CoA acetyltransferase n=1 Tax=Sphingoaurantiacus capsulatus TaxID=1771310 RepID=A0ABV7X6A0_9SPHN
MRFMMVDPRTPVLVGVAQYVDRDSEPVSALSPADMLARVAEGAIADSGGAGIAAALDMVAVIRLFADSGPAFASPFGHYTNLPRSLANRIGASPRELIYPPVGGNTPQMMVNLLAERIANGEAEVALIAGCEPLRTQAKAQKVGIALNWGEDTSDTPDALDKDKPMISRHELAHGIALPVSVYPLFENAVGHHYGRTPLEHRAKIGELMAPFTKVAAANPYATLPIERTPEELVTPTDANRYIGYPYTKFLNSLLFVDQAAALLMMSTAAADRLGVRQDKRVYLHGCADTHEKMLVSDRVDYWSSPAVKVGAAHALAQAGKTPADLQHIEIYSCFPVAVEIAADMIGIAHDDPRGLTLTGGLPYFGGPGNNYSTHGIAEVVERCRAAPGSFGLVFANGGYLTKHGFGVYSTEPTQGAWSRTDPATYQAEIDAMPSPPLAEQPSGEGVVETFTVIFDKGRPVVGTIIGRLSSGERFLAQMHDRLDELIDQPVIGRRIAVEAGTPANIATFV